MFKYTVFNMKTLFLNIDLLTQATARRASPSGSRGKLFSLQK